MSIQANLKRLDQHAIFLVPYQKIGGYISTHHHISSPIVPDIDLLHMLEMCDDHDAHVIEYVVSCTAH